MSLLLENALTREKERVNILIEEGMIREISKTKIREADNNIDLEDSLVTESFVSPHIHLDKVLIGDIIEPNESGTLWEAIQKTWEVKRNYSIEDIKQRASQVIDQQIKFGTTHIRTHVDVDQ
ncbi:MAG: cytosine deaminase, partial [Candidatus Kariarchaeaceae archaeon]